MVMDSKEKAVAVKKFIENFYDSVDRVEIDYHSMELPQLKIYFYQDDPRIANSFIVLEHEIRRDVREHLNIKINPLTLFGWEKTLTQNKNPELYMEVIPLNSIEYNRRNR